MNAVPVAAVVSFPINLKDHQMRNGSRACPLGESRRADEVLVGRERNDAGRGIQDDLPVSCRCLAKSAIHLQFVEAAALSFIPEHAGDCRCPFRSERIAGAPDQPRSFV